ncbi:MAG: phosphoribosylanthranilate isomerase [Nonlabens ulvanivorans]|uniref:N-(5'-phosphoribosyl)anthranilate isomerase n=3 Tax=Nonlabens TaxID=363408 RepID=A0A090WGK0_NONUL|nr:phosphoribosylanthranilate isomerase [Nonlabens xylanidelens]PQJ21449.1 N-(5'-phosphoribosyl)anthranilate isomerase [Nonlabens xylanidelens]GAL74484.1 phosphoribosylanthranilate isomerase [Nonlabens ulvanivorans]
MMIKVCGMRDIENINQLQELDIDFMGIIRYSKSKRFVDDSQKEKVAQQTMNKGTVGVYVNETFENILKDVIPLQLDVIQLHGDEDSAFAKALLEIDIKIFKAFQITEDFDFNSLKEWEELAAQYVGKLFFLFDTATPNYGGSGKKFNWSILDSYKGEVPFLLSGGISKDDVALVKEFKHNMFLGIDLNSKFETEPGVKNIEEIKTFIEKLRK